MYLRSVSGAGLRHLSSTQRMTETSPSSYIGFGGEDLIRVIIIYSNSDLFNE